MLGKLRLEAGKPMGVGAGRVGKQLRTRAQRRFISVAVLRMARIEREHEPVEEAAPVSRGLDEQPVHRGGQPQHRQPFAERRRRGGGAVDAHDPSSRLRGLHPGPQRDRRQVGARLNLGKDGETAARAVAHHVRQRGAAQPAPGCE